MTDADPVVEERREEERRHLRPYRRFLAVVLLIAISAFSWFVLDGIIRALDRLPSAAAMQRLEVVDDRALLACTEDLGKLELRVRQAASLLLAAAPAPTPPTDWESQADLLETRRLEIVARCRLDEPGSDAAQRALARAAAHIEQLLRSYSLLEARFAVEGRPAASEAARALQDARQTLEAR